MQNYIYSELTEKIIKAAFNVYDELGFGFLESVYEKALEIELMKNGFYVVRQSAIPVFFKGQQIGDFRADLIVDNKVIIEIKAVEKIHPIHEAQIINYLRATEIEVGLLINFGERIQFKRKVFTNSKKKHF